MPALCRLLYSTGIRIGEALAIKNEDVDFVNSVIYINKSKNGQQRLVAINKSLSIVLQQYINFRNKIPVDGVNSPEHHFFVTQRGRHASMGISDGGSAGYYISAIFRSERIVVVQEFTTYDIQQRYMHYRN